MKLPSAVTDENRFALKAACRGAVKLAGGGDVMVMASRIDSAGTISKGCNPNEDYFLPLDVALEADKQGGAPLIATAFAAAQGFKLVSKNESAAGKCGVLSLEGLAKLTRQLGDVGPLLLDALADGRMDAAEKAKAVKLIDTNLAALFAARNAVLHGVTGTD